jgi:transcriptional regulator with XRE-family HTH domain
MLNKVHFYDIILLEGRLVTDMTIQESMGLKIKTLRESKKMSQAELAALVGYKDKTAIAKVEAGKVDLPQTKISAFAKALNTSISYLFSDDEPEPQPQTIAAHFDGDEYTDEELDEISKFAAFVKSKRK